MVKKTKLAKDKSVSCVRCQHFNRKMHTCGLDGQQICWLIEEQTTCNAWNEKPYGDIENE